MSPDPDKSVPFATAHHGYRCAVATAKTSLPRLPTTGTPPGGRRGHHRLHGGVEPTKLGRGFEVLLHVDLAPMAFTAVEAFEQRIAAMDEVVELRRMFGIPDYLIRVQIADMDAYERWLTTQLLGDPAIAQADFRMTMKLIKPAR